MINRREFIQGSGACVAAAALGPALSKFPTPYLSNSDVHKRVIVLGMDGVDPGLVQTFVDAGELPNFKRLIAMGKFGPLRTTMPPQSPVAWSSFLTGTNPGGNGIYDFIHRDPQSFTPYLSTSRSYDGKSSIKLGEWKIPLGSGHVDSMRKGPAFYRVLEEHNVDSTLFQVPANFPVTTSTTKAVSGMGTPDLLGGYGSFTYFSTVPVPNSEKFTGGKVVRLYPLNHAAHTQMTGPRNPFRKDSAPVKIPLSIHRDPSEAVLRIKIQSHELVLKQGEWSEWVPLSFELMPMFATLSGIVRFFVKEVHPQLKIYCTPVQIDPMEPSMPICSPASYSRELSQAVGRFYTQGLPADTKALSHGVLDDNEYFEQAKIVLSENMKVFEHEFERFKEGFFFFYFSSTDQNSHMLWRLMDPTHPLYKPEASQELKQAVLYFYRKMDQVLGRTLDKVDSRTLLLVLSDHGFGTFKREFHLSTWLVEQGFTVLKDKVWKDEGDFYSLVDWSKTKAYALGINGIYLNLKGRERNGILELAEAEKVKAAIISGLETVVDPLNGKRIVHRAYDALSLYSGPFVPLAPDILVGYAGGYRVSDEAVLGKFPRDIIGDRTDPWAADHCIDPSFVPGILLSNKPWQASNPAIWDLAPTILNAFGLPVPSAMEGKAIFA